MQKLQLIMGYGVLFLNQMGKGITQLPYWPQYYLFCNFNPLYFILSPYVRFSVCHRFLYGQFTSADVAADREGLLAVGPFTTSEDM